MSEQACFRLPAQGEMVFSAAAKLGCVEREYRIRVKVYPGYVARGRMRPEKAARELAVLAAIIEDYRAVVAKERLL